MLLLIYLVQFFGSNPNISLSLSLSLSLCAVPTAVHCVIKLPLPPFTAPLSSHHHRSLCHPSLFLFLSESKHVTAAERGPRCRQNRTTPSLIVWFLQAQSPLPQATLFGFPTTLLLIAISPSILFLFHNSLFDPLFGFQENHRKIRIIFFFLIYLLKNVFHIWIWESAGNINFLFLIYLLNVFTFGNLLEIKCFVSNFIVENVFPFGNFQSTGICL